MIIRAGFVVCAGLLAAACAPGHLAINRMASALARSSQVYEADDDPEFVRLAAPSTLKTVEMLLAQAPDHPQLLLTACSGFTEYSYAFLQVEAELKASDAAAARDLRGRAARMYRRALGYCLRGLAVRHRAISQDALVRDAGRLLAGTTADEVPFLYWTAVSWGSELSLSQDSLKRVGELVAVRALLGRARALDETWEHGSIYEALIALDGLPPLLGGSPAAARADFRRAIELSNGRSVFAYVALAAAITDQTEKRTLLQQAVGIDVNVLPARRLTNLIAQRYARALLAGTR